MRKQLQMVDRAGPWVCIGAALVVVPLLNAVGWLGIDTVNQLGRYVCFAIVALGIDLIWGFTGILSLCQAMFFCMGAYAIGMHMALHGPMDGANKDIPRCLFVVSSAVGDFKLPWLWAPFKSLPSALCLGLLMPGISAAIFGFFAFRSRVRGVYFSIITQAATLAAFLVLQANQIFNIAIKKDDLPAWLPKSLADYTLWLFDKMNQMQLCGTNGLTNFVTIADFDVTNRKVKLGLYVFSVLTLIGSYAACRYLIQSKFGRVLVAVRDNESRLRFSGYSPLYFKTCAFAFAAVLAGLAGMLYCTQQTIIAPSDLRVDWSIMMVVWVAVGGRGTLTGAIAGSLLVNFAYAVLTSRAPNLWPFFQGGLFISVVLFFPEGLIGLWRKWVGTDEENSRHTPPSREQEIVSGPLIELVPSSKEVSA